MLTDNEIYSMMALQNKKKDNEAQEKFNTWYSTLTPEDKQQFDKYGRRNTYIGIAVVVIILGLIGSCMFGGENTSAPKSTTSAPQTTTTTTSPQQATPVPSQPTTSTNTIPATTSPPVTLDMRPEDFQREANRFIKETAPQIRMNIERWNISSGSVNDVYKYSFSSANALVCGVDKTNKKIKNIMFITIPKTQTDMLNAIAYYGTIIAILNPELDADERGAVIRELGLFEEGADLLNLNGKATRGNVLYSLTSSKEMGIVFGVDVNNE